MMEYVTPPSYGSTIVNVGGIVQDGGIICAGSANLAQHTEIKHDPENKWPEPTTVRFLWSGKTDDGKPVSAEVEGSLGKRLDKVDVMAEVPGFVKTIVGSVSGAKPYIYQANICVFWDPAFWLSRYLVLPQAKTFAKTQHRWQRNIRRRYAVLGGNIHIVSRKEPPRRPEERFYYMFASLRFVVLYLVVAFHAYIPDRIMTIRPQFIIN